MKTTDLGQGWFANALDDGGLTIRNPDKGQRIDLTAESVGRLRCILETEKLQALLLAEEVLNRRAISQADIAALALVSGVIDKTEARA